METANNTKHMLARHGEAAIIAETGRDDVVLPLPVPDAKFCIVLPGDLAVDKMDGLIEGDIETYLLSVSQRSRETGRTCRSHIQRFRSFLASRYGLHYAADLVALAPDNPLQHLVSDLHVDAYREYLLTEHRVVFGPRRCPTGQVGIKPASVNDAVKVIRGLYRYLIAKHRTTMNPASAELVPPLSIPTAEVGKTPELTKAMLLEVLNHPENRPHTLRLRRARCSLVALYEIGVRVREVAQWTRRSFSRPAPRFLV